MDPITIMAGATAAFNGVQKLVATGREVEDVMGQMGKWYGAIAEAKEAQRKLQNPPFYKKLNPLQAGSVEKEALDAIILKKKIETQEKEIRELIMIVYGKETLMEMFELRKQIAKERQEQIDKHNAFRQNISDAVIVALAVGVAGTIIYQVFALVQRYAN